MRVVVVGLLLATAGCRPANVPPEKYFSGEPVEHWLAAVRSKDAKARKKAADVLGNVGPIDPAAVPALIVALADPDAKVRDAATLALSKIGPPAKDAVPALETAAAADADAAVRGHAAQAVKRIRGS